MQLTNRSKVVVKKEMSLDIKIDIDEALRKTIEWNKLLV
jgi:hypothetical protein